MTASRVVSTFLAWLLLATPASADTTGPAIGAVGAGNDQTFTVTVSVDGAETQVDVAIGGPGPSGPEPVGVVTWSELGTGPDGEPCEATNVAAYYDGSDRRLYEQARSLAEGDYQEAIALLAPEVLPLPACPGVLVGVALDAALRTVGGSLGVPQVELDPGQTAITGLRSFLETNVTPMSESYSRTVTLQGQDFTVAVTTSAVHDVFWGDGAESRGLTVPGDPYDPDAPDPGPEDITHVYTDVGTYDLTVVTTWVVTVSAGGEVRRGTFRFADQAPVTVQEVRAVRDR